MNKKGQMGSLNFLQDFVIIFAIAGLTLVVLSKTISQTKSTISNPGLNASCADYGFGCNYSTSYLDANNVSAGLNEIGANMSLLGTVGILIVIIGLIIGLRARQ